MSLRSRDAVRRPSRRSRKTSDSPSPVSKSCVQRWVKIAEIDDGIKPGLTSAEASEDRELKKRVRLLGQESEVLRRAVASWPRPVPLSGCRSR